VRWLRWACLLRCGGCGGRVCCGAVVAVGVFVAVRSLRWACSLRCGRCGGRGGAVPWLGWLCCLWGGVVWWGGSMLVMTGRLHHVVLDCPDPRALAGFYSGLLGDPITYASDDWVVVSTSSQASGLAFQRVLDHRAPTWPDPVVPQQFHLDVMVEDVAAATSWVLLLGATKLSGEDVFADPAGHPFCLVKRPDWAEPISAGEDDGAGPA
jgi:catechol 2,3-dioxygenase-like lactoylglutathione lyase family enzyme